MYKILFVLLSVFSLSSSTVLSSEKFIQNLKDGGKVIFIRHALAPGSGDPNNFDINDCNTQRNLNREGIIQSKLIGAFFSVFKSSSGFPILLFKSSSHNKLSLKIFCSIPTW